MSHKIDYSFSDNQNEADWLEYEQWLDGELDRDFENANRELLEAANEVFTR